jgi:UDP-N-acetylmuramoyl-L-alanyl-D-glutamate--2,6-diaminopimelate ligase
MKLAQLFSILNQFNLGTSDSGVGSDEVRLLTSDSKLAEKGSVYVAVKGTKVDGHSFIPQVVKQGVIGLVVEDKKYIPAQFKGAVAIVPNSRKALGQLAAQFYDNPSSELFCVGVTGTNGKTTTTYFIEQILKKFNWNTGVIGTTGHFLNQKTWPTELTTPDAITLQNRLRQFRDERADAVAFEVSSISLHQYRVQNVDFDVMVFLNFSRDHLDYHGNMAEYLRCKELLFSEYASQVQKKRMQAVLFGDDQSVRSVKMDPRVEPVFFGKGPMNDFEIKIIKSDLTGTQFSLKSKYGIEEIFLPVPGEHNVLNVTAAAIAALHAGMSLSSIKNAISQITGVPGRWERVQNNKGYNVFVDFAHTPEAMSSLLNEVHKLRNQQSRVITVFGCGGGRDKGKRPVMGEVSQAKSDLVIVTSDNPRDEDPMEIINEIVSGMDVSKKNFSTEPDRREAINKALNAARPHDIVLIVGKGHEKFQLIGPKKIPFDDGKVASELIEKI